MSSALIHVDIRRCLSSAWHRSTPACNVQVARGNQSKQNRVVEGEHGKKRKGIVIMGVEINSGTGVAAWARPPLANRGVEFEPGSEPQAHEAPTR